MSVKGQKQSELTPRQRKFIENFINPDSDTFGNSTESYLKSGYNVTLKDPRAARRTAAVSASRLLTNDKVITEITKRRDELAKKAEKIATIKQITGQYADEQLIWAIEECKKPPVDMTNLVACIRILQQRTGQLSDKMTVEIAAAPQLQAALVKELSEIARLRCLPESEQTDNVQENVKQIESTVIDDEQLSPSELLDQGEESA